jgi:hypothetical protein
MGRSINIQCRPSPVLWVGGGVPVLVQVDEAGRAQADEAGNVLMPDPEVVTVHGDENNKPLTDENGAINFPEP